LRTPSLRSRSSMMS